MWNVALALPKVFLRDLSGVAFLHPSFKGIPVLLLEARVVPEEPMLFKLQESPYGFLSLGK